MSEFTLYHGDCLEAMKDIPDGSVDAVITDPPYGTTQNDWDTIVPFDDMWSEMELATKENAAYVFTASQPFTSKLIISNLEMFKHEWIWIKNRGSNFGNTVREPMKEHESILVFSKGKWTFNKQMQKRTGGGKERVNYDFTARTKTTNYREFEWVNKNQGALRVPSSWQKFNTETGKHPNQKPVALVKYLLLTYSNSGDTILDPFMGSGTTGVACAELGRNFIGIEIGKDYFEIAKRRIELAYAQKVMF
jgi:site-specific DNA-methyltransferase (adenine-specific)